MYNNCYKIAGLTVKMVGFGRTFSQSIPYMIEDMPFVDIEVQAKTEIDDIKKQVPDLSDENYEYLASGRSFYRQLIKYDGLMLHSSAVILDGKAYLFTADCGTGKSTHTSIWRRVFGDERVRMLNDDKPALRLEDGVWYAYGTPWCGKTGQNLNLRAPVAGIAVLEQAEENSIERFHGLGAVTSIMRQTSQPTDKTLRIKLLDLLDKLLTQVPVWKLKCNMEPEAAIVSYEAMSGRKFEENETC